MQQPNAAGTRAPPLMQILPLCYLYLFAASRSYTCAQDGLETVQLALAQMNMHNCNLHCVVYNLNNTRAYIKLQEPRLSRTLHPPPVHTGTPTCL